MTGAKPVETVNYKEINRKKTNQVEFPKFYDVNILTV